MFSDDSAKKQFYPFFNKNSTILRILANIEDLIVLRSYINV